MLERQIIELPFFQGLDTKTDAKSIPLGKLLVLQNAVFSAPGKLQKRNGYTALTTNILGGGSISTGAALFTRSNELCMTDTSRTLYSYDSSNTAWVNKGSMPSVTASVASLSNPQYTTYAVDMAVSGTLQCCVYELQDVNAAAFPGTKKGLGYTVVDSTTGQVVVPPSTLDATATSVQPHVVVLGTNFVCYYIQGDLAATAGIYGKTLSTTTPNAGWSAATQLTSGVGTSAQVIAAGAYSFDACVSGTNGYISFNNRGGGTTIFQTTSASPLAVNASTNIAATASRASTVFPDVSGDIVLGYITAVAATAAVYSSSLGVQKLAPAVLDNTLANYSAITGTSTATNTVTFFIGNVAGAQTQQIRQVRLLGASYTVQLAATAIRQLGIAAKAFTYSSGAYCPVWFGVNAATLFTRVQSPQNTIFLIDISGNVLSKALIGTAGCLDTLSSVTAGGFYPLGNSTVSSSTVTFPATASNLLTQLQTYYFGPATGVTVINYQFGAAALSFNFSDTTNNYLRGQLANAVHTSGGVLQMYDGQQAVEHGFLLYPQGITNAITGAAGAITAGVHQYAVTYEWMDGQGQLHRSTPSATVSVTNVLNDKNTLTIPTLRVTAKTGVMIQVYRTTAGGTAFYQISNFNNNGSLFNDKTVDTVTYADTLADASITTNPQLYTTGTPSVLQNAPCAPAGPITVHRNRLFVVDSTNPTQIWYSKLVSPPAPVEFSGFQVMNIDPKGGPITALASLDDKLIVFKSDRIFMVLGQGPDATGGQNDFTDAILVSADTGCATPKSCVVVPDGLMFQSPKGIYQLSRALQMSYIGTPAAGFLEPGNMFVSSALLDPSRQLVRFSLGDSGDSTAELLYDQLMGQWSEETVTSGQTTDACLAPAYALSSTSLVYSRLDALTHAVYQRNVAFTEYGAFFPLKATTGWVKLSGLQGFQRAWRLLVLGDYKAPHTVTVSIAYDYKSSTTQTNTFTFSSDPNPYQVRIHLAQQKCEAIQITISDSAQSGTGESMSLSGLALEVGLKRGAYKLKPAQSG